MGYATTRFQKSVDPNLVCAICGGVLESAVLTPCGHSFCHVCITTWLTRPAVSSCPECRSEVHRDSPKPILSLRNLIGCLEVTCTNKPRGCKEVFILDKEETHLQTCAFVSVTCSVCSGDVLRYQLPSHQMNCVGINTSIEQDSEEDNSVVLKRSSSSGYLSFPTADGRNSLSDFLLRSPYSALTSTGQVMRLLSRIGSLEKQVGRLLDDLHEAHSRNSYLYSQNRKMKSELEDRYRSSESATTDFSQRDSVIESRASDRFQRDYANSYYYINVANTYEEQSSEIPEEVGKLSLLIARYLLRKPKHLDSDLVFQAVKRCYEWGFVSASSAAQLISDHDVHMLLATAYASNWFSAAQRVTLGCWLQCVLRCQGCRRVVEG
ncbi:TNF receptor-associated factor 6 [Aplysia californica]|uniref:TNF receptor-associated factor 6 n=1 Tax=Aplysia californica TaxID=6500 RepID=A0ABM0JSK8_APLCA|nr:TNF receptor-associated factor 6 [Aplysia californica]